MGFPVGFEVHTIGKITSQTLIEPTVPAIIIGTFLEIQQKNF